ncbi:NUDIX domain-containing protein [Burkholderia cenocepacia]|jgi:ADP-ribose pyrophosphatase YjhB (NUDIX family)|uniref:NUDIX hydrolase n=1 Tax=Burkholderia cenocepacia TaxID=95486 RepID=UPI000F5B8EA2|nr:NUDIX hydrolase [Burkholderia cenocepacia]RQU98677.1 NUDIX domain-containing protein [Burkholderia cenocepacia]
MKFCSECGSDKVQMIMPYGDIGLRHICQNCGAIHYSRHSMVAGCVATHEGRILLCQRAIDPYRGMWTIPAGYVETGETLQEAAIRETYEEAGATATHLRLLTVYNLPMFSEVYVLFSADLKTSQLMAGEESLEVKLVYPQEIDWSSLAFPMVREALRHWVAPAGCSHVDVADFLWGPEGGVRVRHHDRMGKDGPE